MASMWHIACDNSIILSKILTITFTHPFLSPPTYFTLSHIHSIYPLPPPTNSALSLLLHVATLHPLLYMLLHHCLSVHTTPLILLPHHSLSLLNQAVITLLFTCAFVMSLLIIYCCKPPYLSMHESLKCSDSSSDEALHGKQTFVPVLHLLHSMKSAYETQSCDFILHLVCKE